MPRRASLPQPQPLLSVKEFNELINIVLTQQVGELSVTGEVSGYQIRQGKWISFDLKDSDSKINCFTSVYQVDLPLKDGQQVIVTGTPRIYVPYGTFSFNVRNVQLTGEGALQKAFEELKAKLASEGLFDLVHKRPLPKFPETIGIITSGEGAAINDIIKVINHRWGGLQLFLAPVLVQGKNAPDELVGALDYFNQHHPVDVILFGRGGGSLEDLQAFNSERVARAIFSSRIPIVAGIGHEHNTSIADLVADVRAATPSNAAEIAVPDRAAIKHELYLLKHKAHQRVEQKITHARHTMQQHLQTLRLAITSRLHEIRLLIRNLHLHFAEHVKTVQHVRQEIDLITQKLVLAMKNNLEHVSQTLHEKQKLLHVLNPKGILKRGYTITYNLETNKPLVCLADIPASGRIKTHLSDGAFASTVAQERSQASLF